MANSNGIIYKNRSANPPLGVETKDMQDVFGTVKNDIGQIVTDANIDINKWAKYKPLRSPKLGILTDAERAEINHGMVINKYTSISGIEGASGDWVYLRPRGMGNGDGGANEWFRHDDFAHESTDGHGYNSHARCFVESTQVPTRYVKGTASDVAIRLTITPKSQLPQDNLFYDDFKSIDGASIKLEDFYFGVLLKGKRSTADAYVFKTSSAKITDYDNEVSFDGTTMDAFDAGTCTAYMFAAPVQCTTEQTSTGTINTTYLHTGAYVLPNAAPQSFPIEINQSSMVIYKLQVEEITGGISFVTDVRYVGASANTRVSNVNIKFYTNSGAGGEEEQIGNSGGYAGRITGGTQNQWTLPTQLTKYVDQFGLNYQEISLRTTYGTYLKAVLSYQIDQRTLTDIRTAHIGGFPPIID